MKDASTPRAVPTHVGAAVLSVLIIPLNYVVWAVASSSKGNALTLWLGAFSLLVLVQVSAGVAAILSSLQHRRIEGTGGIATAVIGGLAALGGPLGWLAGVLPFALVGAGGSWGRPLRIKGRQVHPNLTVGADWTQGLRPDPTGLDEPTRAALEALWLHDAQKEHASVPAFARVSWLLAAVGAPAELLE